MTTLPAHKNIILTGFMGTGKTTIGRLLADQLARPFVDMDAELTRQFGKPIATVFAELGEPAFRQAERALCQRLANQSGLVVSTGGGALVDAENRATFGASGTLICLTADAEEILRRVESNDERPLLGERTDYRQRITTLLASRQAAYGAIPHQIETSGISCEQVVERVLAAVASDAEVSGMTRLPVRTAQENYDICLGDGLLAHVGQLLLKRGLRPGPAAVVSNQMIAEHHADSVLASLQAAGFEPTLCLVPEGEQHKTLATVANLYEQFLIAKLDRQSPVLSLGGGVIGDMAGFAAATYLRGLPYVQMPTSLLAMVDASVGGKTGVDLPQGKNLVGAFKQPELVIMDSAVLATLPAAELSAGLAEVIKHGIIGAPKLFATLERGLPANLKHLIAEAVQVKIAIVEEDPFEHGRRAVLNLGHTFGHALELVSEFSLRHGEAVAVGLIAAVEMAAALGHCDAALVPRIRALVERHGLPASLPRAEYDLDQVVAAMGHDKKRAGKTLRFIIPHAIGDVQIINNPGSAYVRDALGAVLTG